MSWSGCKSLSLSQVTPKSRGAHYFTYRKFLFEYTGLIQIFFIRVSADGPGVSCKANRKGQLFSAWEWVRFHWVAVISSWIHWKGFFNGTKINGKKDIAIVTENELVRRSTKGQQLCFAWEFVSKVSWICSYFFLNSSHSLWIEGVLAAQKDCSCVLPESAWIRFHWRHQGSRQAQQYTGACNTKAVIVILTIIIIIDSFDHYKHQAVMCYMTSSRQG